MAAAVPGSVTHPSGVPPFELRLDGRTLALNPHRPRVMGIVNVTPDSFSDGGRWVEPDAAVEHALRLVEEGADILDLGAESTRPGGGIYGDGAEAIGVDEEMRRLQPVLERLRPQTTLTISVDTRKPAVARWALDAGAGIVNDIGGLRDPKMVELVAARGCPVVVMHSRGDLATMQQRVRYVDVAGEVAAELGTAAESAARAGVEQVIVDPGIGFGKTFADNLALVAGLDRTAALGYPVLLGSSRKGYLGALTGRGPDDRVAAGLATIGRALGRVHIVRVHDVAPTVDFLQTWAAHDDPSSAFADPVDEPMPVRGFPDGSRA